MSLELYPLAAAFDYTPHELHLNRQKQLSWRQWRRQSLRFGLVAWGGILLVLAPILVAWGLVTWATDQTLAATLSDQRVWVAYGLAAALALLYVASNQRPLLLGLDLLLGRVRMVRGKAYLQGSYLRLGGKYQFLLEEVAQQALQPELTYRAFILPYSQTLLSIEFAE